MISRRALFGLGLSVWPVLSQTRTRQYESGDLVKVVALPAYCRRWDYCENTRLRRHAALLQTCLGTTYRVITIGEDGRPELDVSRTGSILDPTLTGCSISIERDCVELFAKRAVLPRWRPPVWAV